MATDSQGNLYVPDFYNNRILRYDSPFTTDSTADYVWGQADFSGTTCNRGSGFDLASARSLCLAPPPGFGDINVGVAIDSAGNLWVADNHNNRMLRFPFDSSSGAPAKGSDLVLGQPDFTTVDFETREKWGPYFERMRADPQGRLWVLNGTLWGPNIIYGYRLPLTTGATPIFTLTSPLPLLGGGMFTWTDSLYLGGIEVQSNCDCLWLSDEENRRVFRIRDVSTQPTVDIVLGQLNASGMQCNQGRGRDAPSQDSLCHPGWLAFDLAGNLYVSDHNLETKSIYLWLYAAID